MSDQSQGPGWWLASDGKWYPPDQAPAVPPPETWGPPPGPPPSAGMPAAAKVAIALVVGFFVLGLLSIVAIQLLGEEAEKSFEATGDDDPAVVPPGYQRIEGDGVSIAVPASWDQVSPDDFAMSAEEFRQAFPNAPEEMLDQGSQMVQQGAVLVAFDTDSEFGSNVNVLNVPGEAPLGLVESQAESELSTLGAQVHGIDRVDVPVGEALRVEYTLDVTTPAGGTVSARGAQFYVPLDGRTYVVTISSLDDGSIADAMIDSFRVG